MSNLQISVPARIVSVLVVMAWLSVSLRESIARERGITLDEMMQIEGFAAGLLDPSGNILVYERQRPYNQFTDYSFRTYAFSKSGHQLWRYDLDESEKPALLPGVDPESHSYLQGFSPSGRFVAVMQYQLGELSLSAYDVVGEKLVKFEPTPTFSKAGEHNPIWVSDSELIFAASQDGQWPALTSVRAYAGATLKSSWEEAWQGTVVTAHEVRTIPEDQSDQQEAGYLVRANASTGRTETVAEGLYADLRVSPDRRWLAALAVSKPRPTDPERLVLEDPRRYSLTLFDLDSGEVRPLAQELEFFPYTITWSSDGRRVAAFGWATGQTPREGRFHVVDVSDGTVTQYAHIGLDLVSERERGWLQRPERSVFLDSALAVFARKIPEGEDQTPRFTYRDVRPSGLSRPDWYLLSADGTSRNLTSQLSGVSGIPVHAGTGQFTIWGEDGAFRVQTDGRNHRLTPELPGRFRLFSPGTFATRSGAIRPEFTNEALFDVSGEGPAKIVMVDLREGREDNTIVVEAPMADAVPLAGSLSARVVLFRAEDGPASRLLVAEADGGHVAREVASINTHLNGLDMGTWRIVSYEIEDPEGLLPPQTIESCVLLPPGYDPKAPPPLVVDVYPSVGPRCEQGAPRISYPDPHSPYLWAGNGYAYARLTTPRELIRTQDGPIAGMDEVIEAGVSALVEHGYADPERLALTGFSQGGVSALYVAAHSNRFKAVIAKNSWANLFSHYFGTSGIYTYAYGQYFGNFGRYDAVAGSDFGIGRTVFEDPEFYYRNSPIFLAPKIDAPVLLMHSDMDDFPMSEFDGMYAALLRAGKDARYVRYLGEGHGPSSPANIRDMWDRKLKFLEEHGVAP